MEKEKGKKVIYWYTLVIHHSRDPLGKFCSISCVHTFMPKTPKVYSTAQQFNSSVLVLQLLFLKNGSKTILFMTGIIKFPLNLPFFFFFLNPWDRIIANLLISLGLDSVINILSIPEILKCFACRNLESKLCEKSQITLKHAHITCSSPISCLISLNFLTSNKFLLFFCHQRCNRELSKSQLPNWSAFQGLWEVESLRLCEKGSSAHPQRSAERQWQERDTKHCPAELLPGPSQIWRDIQMKNSQEGTICPDPSQSFLRITSTPVSKCDTHYNGSTMEHLLDWGVSAVWHKSRRAGKSTSG